MGSWGFGQYAASQDKDIRVWDVDSLHCKHVLKGHTQEVLCLCITGVRSGRAGVSSCAFVPLVGSRTLHLGADKFNYHCCSRTVVLQAMTLLVCGGAS